MLTETPATRGKTLKTIPLSLADIRLVDGPAGLAVQSDLRTGDGAEHLFMDDEAYGAAVATLQETILQHHLCGLDVTAKAYRQGLEHTLQKILRRYR